MSLDHECYPHIFDLVIFFAPRASLLRLRATSRSTRKVADAYLNAGHLVVRAQYGDPKMLTKIFVSNDGDRVPAFASWALGIVPAVPGHRRWLTAADAKHIRQWVAVGTAGKARRKLSTQDALRRLGLQHKAAAVNADLGLTEVVDLVGLGTLNELVEWMLVGPEDDWPGKIALHLTLRFMHNTTRNRNIYHFYTDMPVPGPLARVAVDEFILFIPLPHAFYRNTGLFPRPQATRTIVNLSVDRNDYLVNTGPELVDRMNVALAPFATDEIIWAFHPAVKHTSAVHYGLDTAWNKDRRFCTTLHSAALLDKVAKSISDTQQGGADTTVVGLDAVRDWLAGSGDGYHGPVAVPGWFANDELENEFFQRMIRHWYVFLHDHPHLLPDQVPCVLEVWKHDEYREWVDERAALEMEETGTLEMEETGTLY